jgi:hypothetical membrane protein
VSASRQRVFAAVGIGGALVFLAASAITAAVYSGSEGEAYSPLNHWVSELGELGVSQLAPAFNAGVIISGTCLVIFMYGLATSRTAWLRIVYGAAGAIAGVAGALVGIFPMNNLAPHGLAALTFFDAGWIAVGLASIDFVRRPDARFPRWLAVIGALTVVVFLTFVASLASQLGNAGLAAPAARPAVWIVPSLEWLVLIGILAWVCATGVTWWRAEHARGT